MAVESPPAFLQAGSYGAEQTRRSIYALLARGASIGSVAGGLVGPSDCQLSPPGSGMSVNVAPGEVIVPGTTSATQSGYYGHVSSSTSLGIAAADPSNPRIDTVIAQVQDAAYAGSINSFQIAVVTGTPTAGATLTNLSGAGAVPASSLVLGYVLVPATATNIVAGDISNVAVPADLGLNAGLTGHSNIPTSQSVTSTTYATLPTLDQVTGIVLPANGLLAIWFQGTWQESVGGAGRAAIFIGSNQLKIADGVTTSNGAVTQAAATDGGTANIGVPLFTTAMGLMSAFTIGAYPGDATTGQVVGAASEAAGFEINGSVGSTAGTNRQATGGPCFVFAAAGTYTVSVRFKASSGSVTASNRKLWVQALPFS